MKDVLMFSLVCIVTLTIASIIYGGANEYRRHRQSVVCEELGYLYGLETRSVDSYNWSNSSDCYMNYKGKWVSLSAVQATLDCSVMNCGD